MHRSFRLARLGVRMTMFSEWQRLEANDRHMANVLDIRRRIRSVTNTRQITKAMKMVSAAKLRRAQERALAARPYAQMLTNVLKSLVSRAEICDPETGEPRHPLLAQRPEKNVFLIVVTGDKGLAGAFNTNILKAATKFLESKQGKNIEIEAFGRKGRDFLRRRYKSAPPRPADSQESAGTTLVGEQIRGLTKLEYSIASEFAQRVIDRYSEQGVVQRAPAEVRGHSDLSWVARICCRRARRSHDCHGCGDKQCHRHD